MRLALILTACLFTQVAHAEVVRAEKSDALLEETLFAGGARTAAEMARSKALYHQRIDPIVAVAEGQPAPIAAELLLRHLHMSYGGTDAVLNEYTSHQYSVVEALETGHFNCLAATTLFVLAARQAGLNVDVELYEDHIRPVLTFSGVRYQVEATSAYGFNADEVVWHARGSFQTGGIAFELPNKAEMGELVTAIYASATQWGLPASVTSSASSASASASTYTMNTSDYHLFTP
jgi:hypothetical protein